MKSTEFELIDVNSLRVGMYVELELGWLAHPFPTGSFKISSQQQIETIHGLGLKQVRYLPEKSDLPVDDPSTQSGMDEAAAARELSRERESRKRRAALIAAQQSSLNACEDHFKQAQEVYRQAQEHVLDQPLSVREQCLSLVSTFSSQMNSDGESAIRLLSEGVGERAVMHSVNVTVMSMLLGKALHLPEQGLMDLGIAALLHDIGKMQLPSRVRSFDEGLSVDDFKHYQDHVSKSVAIANRMQLSEGAQMAIAQHHELMDGSGFPARPAAEEITLPARILALVNRYDNLCNPVRLVTALTPHEALSLLFAQHKARYDNMVLSAYIRMMGVYPPGSVVQLIDGRFGLVVSVNSVRPLKPRLIVHEPSVPRREALILDLENQPGIGIRRSLKPSALPTEALEYLGPRQRVTYYFENSGPTPLAEV